MAEQNLFELKIISPDEIFYEGTCEFLEFTSVDGERGVYKNHIPLLTILDTCVMKIHQGADVKKAAIMGGFVEILQDKIVVMAEGADWPEDIDLERAKAAKKRAEERIKRAEAGLDLVRAEAALKRAITRIHATK